MSAALLLMDYQEGLCRTDGAIGGPSGLGGEVERRGTLQAAHDCLGVARELGLTILHVHVRFDADYVLRTNRTESFGGYESGGILGPNDTGGDICGEVAPGPGELVLAKGWVDPFVNSPLFAIFTARRVSTVFLGGVATNFVVESAARHAGDLGYDVVVVDEMCASFSQELHETSLNVVMPVFARVISAGEFRTTATAAHTSTT